MRGSIDWDDLKIEPHFSHVRLEQLGDRAFDLVLRWDQVVEGVALGKSGRENELLGFYQVSLI